MSGLAREVDPYYPESWLSVDGANKLLEDSGLGDVKVSKGWCNRRKVEVSSTGHMRKVSLDLAIEDIKREREEWD